MMRATRLMPLLTLALGFAAAGVHAQNQPGGDYRPVDRLIEDLDPLQTSLRRLNQGLWREGQDSPVYRRQDEQGGRFLFRSGGVWAQYDRSQYNVVRKGKLKGTVYHEVPANTVFFIGPPPEARSRAIPTRQREPRPGRIDWTVRADVDRRMGRISRRVDGLEANRDGRPGLFDGPVARPIPPHQTSDASELMRSENDWQRYLLLRRAQRHSVLEAIDRALGGAERPAAPVQPTSLNP